MWPLIPSKIFSIYEEVDGKPGISVEVVSSSKNRVKAASSTFNDSDLDIKEYLCIDYQKQGDVPGVEIGTSHDIFWVPMHCPLYLILS